MPTIDFGKINQEHKRWERTAKLERVLDSNILDEKKASGPSIGDVARTALSLVNTVVAFRLNGRVSKQVELEEARQVKEDARYAEASANHQRYARALNAVRDSEFVRSLSPKSAERLAEDTSQGIQDLQKTPGIDSELIKNHQRSFDKAFQPKKEGGWSARPEAGWKTLWK